MENNEAENSKVGSNEVANSKAAKKSGKTVINSCFIAFSMYSRLPVPKREWKQEDMRYVLCFFPLVGVLLGAAAVLWHGLCGYLQSEDTVFYAAGQLVLPIMLTGGIHLDGFLDTTDALRSYADREKRLEILQDPHVGSFAVIETIALSVLSFGALTVLTDPREVRLLAGVYVLSRVCSGLCAVTLPCAKREGLLFLFSDSAHKRAVIGTLCGELILCAAYLLFQSPAGGALLLLLAGIGSLAYARYTRSVFGGITGDTEGWFLVCLEAASMLALAVFSKV